jgi:hypothetical protein
MLNFNGLSWPHVTVGTLKKNVPIVIPPWIVDPDMPIDILQKLRPPIPDTGAPIRVMQPIEFKPVPVPQPTPPPPPVLHPIPVEPPVLKPTPVVGQAEGTTAKPKPKKK